MGIGSRGWARVPGRVLLLGESSPGGRLLLRGKRERRLVFALCSLFVRCRRVERCSGRFRLSRQKRECALGAPLSRSTARSRRGLADFTSGRLGRNFMEGGPFDGWW